MLKQLRYFVSDYYRICGRKKARLLYLWLGRVAVGIFIYRLERGMFISLGKFWTIFRILLSPFLWLLYAYSNCEINYRAAIGPGLLVLHAAPGIVISGKSVIGRNFTLTGGNIIGGRVGIKTGDIKIGDGCTLGANAVVLGPVTLGNNIMIGACALVLHSCGDDIILVGNPAKPLIK
jgi:serine O-acetyltransferase